METSCGASVSSCWRSLAPTSTSIVRMTMVSGDCSSSAVGTGLGTDTAITTSAQVWRAISTATFRLRPPSPSTRPSIVTGAKTPGTDMLARSACGRSAGVEHDHLARLHVGRDGAERYRQLVEIANAEAARDQQSDRLLDVLRVYEAAGRREPAVAKTELEAIAVDITRELAAHRLVSALALEGDRLLEGDAADRGHRPRPRSGPRHRYRPPARPCSYRRCNRSGRAAPRAPISTPTCAAPLAPPPPSARPMRGRTAGGAAEAGIAGAVSAAAAAASANPATANARALARILAARPSWTRRLNSLPGMPSFAQVACAS